MDNPGKLTDFYDVDKKKLGEGHIATVKKAKHKSSGEEFAIKTMQKKEISEDKVAQEIDALKKCDHPNIIKLFETFQDHGGHGNFYLVLELCLGGEIFDAIIDQGHFTETQAAILIQQLFAAIFHFHSKGLVHRDIKPENALLKHKGILVETQLKVISFELCHPFKPGDVLKTKVGTPYYVAPQVLAGKYDQACDLWSSGVILYVFICGYPPFYGETDQEILKKVKLGNFSFNAADWKNVSEDCKNLIRMLLKINPRDRYTAEQALHHEWIKTKAPQANVPN